MVGLFVLLGSLIIAILRPPWYVNLLLRLGIFRSARPNDMVVAGIGRTFQNIRLFANMTALENVLVGMHSRCKANPSTPPCADAPPRREGGCRARRAAIGWRTWACTVGANELARNLPYGDQRRLEIARALASRPKLLLLDEPTAGMNPPRPAA